MKIKIEEKSKKEKKVKPIQKGTGVHLDSNPFELWKLETSKLKYEPLDRFRIFQSQIPLNDQQKGDSGLEIIPGFSQYCLDYYKKHPSGDHGRNLPRWGPHNTKLSIKHDSKILHPQEVQRIPPKWNLNDYKSEYTNNGKKSFEKIVENIQKLSKEHENLPFIPYEEGDFIIWDIRSAHCNGDENTTNSIRKTFYHAYLLGEPDDENLNHELVKHQRECRKTGIHPKDFPKTWAKNECNSYKPIELSNLGKCLYGFEKWNKKEDEKLTNKFPITQTHIDYFKRYGYVVIENVIPKELTKSLKIETDEKIKEITGIDMSDFEKNFDIKKWSNVAGSFGGMIELFWLKSMEEIRQHENLYSVTVQLMKSTWAEGDEFGFEQPFGKLDSHKLWVYVDRQNYRFPQSFIEGLKKRKIEDYSDKKKKKKMDSK
eukprot:gene10256-2675_t